MVVVAVLGPLALGGSLVASLRDACGACPCEEPPESAHEGVEPTPDGAAAGGTHGEAPCPEDCPDCPCGAPVVVALAPVSVPGDLVCGRTPKIGTASELPPAGDISGVFRPPRPAVAVC